VSRLPDARTIQPQILKGLKWNITKDAIEAEMKRQNIQQVDFKFCLSWHTHACETGGALLQGITANGYPSANNDIKSLAALVHFMVLENVGLIDQTDADPTVLGNALQDTPVHLQEPCLVALELLKYGLLSGEPYDPAQSERPFPEQVNYPRSDSAEPKTKAMLLLCRVMSLVPMRLKNDMWNADVDFDLAAFHALVRILKRALRQLVESSLASVLMTNLERARTFPPGFMCASPKKDDHLQSPAVLPTFMLPRACMGIVLRFFLEYRGATSGFARDVALKFPCCAQPLEDLRIAFAFWEDLKRCVDAVREPLECEETWQEMNFASKILVEQQQKLGLFAVG